jgi:aspartate 1-decarboxylase
MLLSLLKAKLHRACVTAGSLDYPGSIGISRELMDAVGLLHYERVLVSNLRDGARFETYVIPEEQPGQIVLNGAAAHLGRVGDRVIIMSFAQLHPEEVVQHQPRIAVLSEANQIVGGDH